MWYIVNMNWKCGYRYSHNLVYHTTVRFVFYLDGWMVSYVLRLLPNRVMIVLSRMDVTVVGDSLL